MGSPSTLSAQRSQNSDTLKDGVSVRTDVKQFKMGLALGITFSMYGISCLCQFEVQLRVIPQYIYQYFRKHTESTLVSDPLPFFQASTLKTVDFRIDIFFFNFEKCSCDLNPKVRFRI